MPQEKSENSALFSEKSEALARTLGCNLDDIPERMGVSKDMFYAYRTGRHPISRKAWRKLEAVEASIGNRSGEYQIRESSVAMVGEDGPCAPDAARVKRPLPAWWGKMPSNARDLEKTLPDVHARLRLAAILRHEADTHAVPPSTLHMSPLHDAFIDLGLTETGFTTLPGFSILAEAFCAELANLRITHARMEVEASNAAMESLLGRLLHAIGLGPMNLTTKERQEAEAVIARLKQQAAEEAQKKESGHGKIA